MSDYAIEDLDALRAFLRKVRTSSGLRQQDLAASAGLERKTVIGLESHADIRLETLARVARSLGYDLVLRQRSGAGTESQDDLEKVFGFGATGSG